MLKKIGIVVAVLLVILIGVIATRPADFKVTRSKTLAAQPEAVYAPVTTAAPATATEIPSGG